MKQTERKKRLENERQNLMERGVLFHAFKIVLTKEQNTNFIF